MTENQKKCFQCGRDEICKFDEKKIEKILDNCLEKQQEKQQKKSEDSGWLAGIAAGLRSINFASRD